jgi:hypothetical protein
MAYTTINKSTDYFRTKTYTGNATNDTAITWDESSNMKPDFLWFKNRSQGQSHALFDVIRGADKRLISNSSGAEGTEATNLDSFDTNGFTVDYEGIVNGNNDNMVTWGWKANGSGSANTDGSISSTVSANTTSGFSIVTYTGNGTDGATVGHGLTSPKLILIKSRGAATPWIMFGYPNHPSFSTDGSLLQLESTSTMADSSTKEASIGASTVTFVDAGGDINASGVDFVMYCFQEKQGYSKFGSYIGNGNADGTFVYTGFKPAFVIHKRTDTGASWMMYDNKRQTINPKDQTLFADLNNAESGGDAVDFLSNGFKQRSTGASQNASGGTYIYMAFAEAPLVGTNNVPCTAR